MQPTIRQFLQERQRIKRTRYRAEIRRSPVLSQPRGHTTSDRPSTNRKRLVFPIKRRAEISLKRRARSGSSRSDLAHRRRTWSPASERTSADASWFSRIVRDTCIASDCAKRSPDSRMRHHSYIIICIIRTAQSCLPHRAPTTAPMLFIQFA